MKVIKNVLMDAPGMYMDWGFCVLVLWFLSVPADWRLALFLFVISFVGYIVRAAVASPAPGRDLR